MNLRPYISFLAACGLASVIPLVSLQAQEVPAAALKSEPKQASNRFGPDQLTTALRDALVTHFNLEGDLQVDLLRAWSEPAASFDPYSVEILEFPSKPGSNVLLRFCLVSGSWRSPELTLPLRLQLWREAVFTREPVNRDDAFDIAVMELRRVDSFRERDVVYASGIDGRYTFARSVSAGRMLTWHDLGRRALVRKGDLVEVAAIDGSLCITMKATALQNGSDGDVVAVRNLESKRDIRAQVVGEKRVQVRF